MFKSVILSLSALLGVRSVVHTAGTINLTLDSSQKYSYSDNYDSQVRNVCSFDDQDNFVSYNTTFSDTDSFNDRINLTYPSVTTAYMDKVVLYAYCPVFTSFNIAGNYDSETHELNDCYIDEFSIIRLGQNYGLFAVMYYESVIDGSDYVSFDIYSNFNTYNVNVGVTFYSIDSDNRLLADNHTYSTISPTFDKYTINIPYNHSLYDGYFVNFTLINLFTATGYNQGYTDGYDVGYDTGSNDGYNQGYETGYNVGYTNGYNAGGSATGGITSLLFAVADTPIYYLKSLFSVEIFGIKVYAVVLSMVTTMVLVWVIRKFVF